MSKQIICPECSAGNVPGSKFCNNCGSPLPPSTHIICPNCETPNPRNRLYCDNCGARLVEEHPVPEETSPSDVSKPSGADSFFSLPTRKPGDTGELAPGLSEGAKPDEIDDFEASPQGDLPHVEELTGKEGTADLPDWLVESNAEPIIKPPEAITTEHYFDMLKRSIEEETGEEATAEDIAAAAADLPEWLTAAAVPSSESEHEKIQTDDTIEIPDWISLPGENAPDETEPEPSDEDDLHDWLAELGPASTDILASPLPGEQEAESDDDNLADWLSELGPPNTNILAQPSDPDLSDGLLEESSDWLTDLAVPDTGPLPDSTILEQPSAAGGEETDDWLADLTVPDTGPLAESDFDKEDQETIISQTPFDQDESSWLTELGSLEPDSQVDLGSDLEETLVSRPEDLPDGDWLSEVPPAETGSEEQEADWLATPIFDDADEESILPENLADVLDDKETAVDLEKWFTDELPDELVDEAAAEPDAEEEAPSDSLLARLSDFVPDETAVTPDETPPAPAEADDEADVLAWLGDDEPEAESEPAATGTAVPAELPDWLDDLGPGHGTDEFSALNQLAGGDDTLPEWFDGEPGDADSDSGFSPEADLFLTGLLDSQKSKSDIGLDWLTDDETTAEPEPATAEGDESTAGEPASEEEVEETLTDEDPAWLTSLFTGPLAELSEEEQEQEAEEVDLDALFGEPEEITEIDDTAVILEPPSPEIPPALEAEVEPPIPVSEDGADDDAWFGDGLEDADEPLPDWIEQLGPTHTPDIHSEPPLIPSDELPDWVENMRPEIGSEAGSLLPRASEEDDTLLTAIPDDLGKAELPDWLQEVTTGGDETDLPVEAGGITGWIESESGLAELLALDDEEIGAGSDWDAVLGELPPSAPLEDRLAEADLPDWIEALKPRELTTEGAEPEAEPEPEASGPLTGMRGVVEIAPIITMPRPATVPNAFAVTKEQQQQASLLKQLSLAQPTPVKAPGQIGIKPSSILRLVLVLFLIGSILAGVLGPDWLATNLPEASPAVNKMHTAVQAAAGQPVLVAFEYTPALAGELSPQAKLLVQALADNGSQIVTISQSATGTAIATNLTEGKERVEIGLLPGEAVGLRQLGSCLDTTCTTIYGRDLTSSQQQALAEIGLIILLTGNQDSLVNWVEQVGSVSNVPVAAGITEALRPSALPYSASGQLDGLLVGAEDTAVYQQSFLNTTSAPIMDTLNAQGIAQIVTAVLLLLGALVYSLSAVRKKDKT